MKRTDTRYMNTTQNIRTLALNLKAERILAQRVMMAGMAGRPSPVAARVLARIEARREAVYAGIAAAEQELFGN